MDNNNKTSEEIISESLNNIIGMQTVLLEKYQYSFVLLQKEAEKYSNDIQSEVKKAIDLFNKEIKVLDVNNYLEKLKNDAENIEKDMKDKLDAAIKDLDIDGLIKQFDIKFNNSLKSLESKINSQESSLNSLIDNIKTETSKSLSMIKAEANKINLHLSGIQHNIPNTMITKSKYEIIITGGDNGSIFEINTDNLFSLSKSKNIKPDEKITITAPTLSDNITELYYEIEIIELKRDNTTNNKIVNVLVSNVAEPGEQIFSTPGDYTFIVPKGVKSISAVCVGGGAGGNRRWSGYAGNGGALAYANNISVKPGDKISVHVGAGGSSNQNSSSCNQGGDSYLVLNGSRLFTAEGGRGGNTNTRAKPVSGTVNCYGGTGGIGGSNTSHYYGGGGGAGGYLGNGGNGTYNARDDSTNISYRQGTGGAGNGGAGYESSTYGFGGGGGAGLFGVTGFTQPKATAGTNGNSFYNSNYYGGKSGSGGFPGAGNNNSTETIRDGFGNSMTVYHGEGGKFGGGGAGGGSSVSNNSNFCRGGSGGIRIIWGENRTFPYNARKI